MSEPRFYNASYGFFLPYSWPGCFLPYFYSFRVFFLPGVFEQAVEEQPGKQRQSQGGELAG